MRKSYNVSTREFTYDQMIESMQGILRSDFFGSHRLWQGNVETAVATLNMSSGWRRGPNDEFFLPSFHKIAKPLDAMVSEMTRQEVIVNSVSFIITPSEEALERYGLKKEDYANTDEDLKPELRIEGSDRHDEKWHFSVNHGMNKDWFEEYDIDYTAELKKINKWYKDIDAELAKVAPHLLATQPAL